VIAYLNAGFGEPLSRDDLSLIKSLGYAGVRQDVPEVEVAAELVDNVLDEGMTGIFVVPVALESSCHDIAHAVARRAVERQQGALVMLEAGNEEDLSGKRWTRDPIGWARLVADVATIADSHSNIAPGGHVRVVSGGVSSVSRQAMGWLDRSRVRDLAVGVGYHQYRSTSPAAQLDGYRSREHEFATLREAAGDRPLWCTESGWHTAQRKSGTWPFSRKWAYTDTQVAEFLTAEIKINEEFGAECFVVYQLNDGPDPSNDQDRFGIRRTDGTLKPQARILLT
jgi:hypothetical protein